MIVITPHTFEDFYYLTGVKDGIYVRIKRREILITSELEDVSRARIKEIVVTKSYVKELKRIVKREHVDVIYLLETAPLLLFKKLERKLKVSVAPIKNFVERKRRIKKREEIEEIRKCCRVAIEAIQLARKLAKRKNCREIRLHLLSFLARRGYECRDLIVSSGRESAIPHACSTKAVGENLLVDVFPRSVESLYHGDVTRTFVFSKSSELYDFLKLCEEAKKVAESMIREGVRCRDLEVAVRDFFKEHGVEKYFIHSLGHGVGLNVHERPYVSKRSKEVLKRGDVIAIEPGLYKQGCGGVRMEDTLVVRRSSFLLLS